MFVNYLKKCYHSKKINFQPLAYKIKKLYNTLIR